MELRFDDPFDAREACRPASDRWSAWFEQLPRTPEFAVVWSGPPVNGYTDAPWRIGGYFLEPIRSVVSLRPFDDAIEGRVELEGPGEPVPYVFFELEKIARMMLHDSGLAFEILASPARLRSTDTVADTDEPHELLRRAVTRDLLAHYRENTGAGLDDLRSERDVSVGAVLRLVRELATGAALQEGRASLELSGAVEGRHAGLLDELSGSTGTETVEQRRDELLALCESLTERLDDEASSALPVQPDDYDAIDERIVDRRLSSL